MSPGVGGRVDAMDAALHARLGSGQAPFDGLVAFPIGEPAGEPQLVDDVRLTLAQVVPVLASETSASLQTFLDWWEHDEHVSISTPTPWSALVDTVGDRERFIDSATDDYWVSRAWYPTDFRFLLRWRVIGEDGRSLECSRDLVGSWDLTASGDVVAAVSSLVPGLDTAPARQWFYDRL
jgi:hypothetical protein